MKKILLATIPVILIVIGYLIFKKNSTPAMVASPEPTPSTSLTIKGSDTEVQMVSNLAQAFSSSHSGNTVSVTGGGSGVGIAALLNKEIDLANSSRKMTDDELKQGSDKGLNIGEFVVARDGITVITNKDNPIKKLTIDELAKIYTGKITNWKEVGGKNGPITIYGRQSTSGTYSFFRSAVLQDDYSPNMRSLEGNEAIVDAVTADKSGIGYVGVGYVKNEDGSIKEALNVVLVAKDAKTDAVSPLDTEAVLSGRYPIFRAIYQYVPNMPVKGSAVEQFLQFEASDVGQDLVRKAGFYTLTSQDREENTAFFEKIQ